MGQEKTPKVTSSDSVLQGGKVRPKSQVQVLFRNSKYHGKPYAISMVHPSLADKLIKDGKAELYEGKLTKDMIKANEEARQADVVSKGRTPGKGLATKEDEDEFDDLDSKKDNKKK